MLYLLEQRFSIPRNRRARLTELLQGADGGTPYPDLDAAFDAAGLRSPDDPDFTFEFAPKGSISGLYPREGSQGLVPEEALHTFLERVTPVVAQDSRVMVARPSDDEVSIYGFRKKILKRRPHKGGGIFVSSSLRPYASLYVAMRNIREASLWNGDNAQMHKEAARWLFTLRRFEACTHHLERALALDNFTAQAWDALEAQGWLIEAHLNLHQEGHPQRPLEELRRLCLESIQAWQAHTPHQDNPDRLNDLKAEPHYQLARVYARLEQRDPCLESLRRATALADERRQQAAQDPDFAALQPDTAFQALVSA
jgi:tetratricopeptide (TPR) repeat protein